MSCRLFIPSLVRLLCCGVLSVAVVEGVRRQDRTGERGNDPRKGVVKPFKFVAEEGLSVTKAQMLTFLSGEEFDADPEFLENGNVFMKATKNARQQDSTRLQGQTSGSY
ncbi:hypothetical protein PC129_g13040 [Phytophthora cactorum]|uniref:RxLR effector protein n=1 Tax=Phytophthora cactorum TaxID=29920 RepID=A0A8T1HV15_9STRA|nr:hypothetical protein PC129_g13040 [Phytophthora cactorum]